MRRQLRCLASAVFVPYLDLISWRISSDFFLLINYDLRWKKNRSTYAHWTLLFDRFWCCSVTRSCYRPLRSSFFFGFSAEILLLLFFLMDFFYSVPFRFMCHISSFHWFWPLFHAHFFPHIFLFYVTFRFDLVLFSMFYIQFRMLFSSYSCIRVSVVWMCSLLFLFEIFKTQFLMDS